MSSPPAPPPPPPPPPPTFSDAAQPARRRGHSQTPPPQQARQFLLWDVTFRFCEFRSSDSASSEAQILRVLALGRHIQFLPVLALWDVTFTSKFGFHDHKFRVCEFGRGTSHSPLSSDFEISSSEEGRHIDLEVQILRVQKRYVTFTSEFRF